MHSHFNGARAAGIENTQPDGPDAWQLNPGGSAKGLASSRSKRKRRRRRSRRTCIRFTLFFLRWGGHFGNRTWTWVQSNVLHFVQLKRWLKCRRQLKQSETSQQARESEREKERDRERAREQEKEWASVKMRASLPARASHGYIRLWVQWFPGKLKSRLRLRLWLQKLSRWSACLCHAPFPAHRHMHSNVDVM